MATNNKKRNASFDSPLAKRAKREVVDLTLEKKEPTNARIANSDADPSTVTTMAVPLPSTALESFDSTKAESELSVKSVYTLFFVPYQWMYILNFFPILFVVHFAVISQ